MKQVCNMTINAIYSYMYTYMYIVHGILLVPITVHYNIRTLQLQIMKNYIHIVDRDTPRGAKIN